MIKMLLEQRNLPGFLKREEMLDILLKEEYGYMPEKPEHISFKTETVTMPEFCAGKAVWKKVYITSVINGNEFTFPVNAVIPTSESRHPFFVCVNFRDNVPDLYIPTEEIIDNGFAVLSFCYNDITKDNDDFTDGLAGVLYKNGERKVTDAGKIAMWAWAAQRVMDYAETQDCLDKNVSIICGHSRLGKTALLTAATDERFKCAYSNNSGCSGIALSRGKTGEEISNICEVFPYWFCENYKKYMDKETEMTFDQHYLAALIAPRFLYVASAAEDLWADPQSEFLTCAAVGKYYEKLGKTGFVCDDKLPCAGDTYHQGSVGYHMRSGLHYMGREDWQKAIEFVKKHML